MFDQLKPEELSALFTLLLDAEYKFAAVFGGHSVQATEMYAVGCEMPTFEYVDVDPSFLPGRR